MVGDKLQMIELEETIHNFNDQGDQSCRGRLHQFYIIPRIWSLYYTFTRERERKKKVTLHMNIMYLMQNNKISFL